MISLVGLLQLLEFFKMSPNEKKPRQILVVFLTSHPI